jgi:hypothetical protein
MNEELKKSIDSVLDEIFAESEVIETIEKADALKQESDTKADAAVKKAPKFQSDEDRKAGRPKQISDVPEEDEDGERTGEYDKKITEKAKEESNPEAKQVKESSQVKKSEISEEEFQEYQALKKAKAEKEVELLKKAEKETQDALIKSIVEQTASKYEGKLEEMKKTIEEQNSLIKAFAKKPQASKSITNIEVLEKSSKTEKKESEYFSKSEKLDAAEELFKAGKIPMEAVVELENTGAVFHPVYRKLIEQKLNNN